jgi:hypothetical protein
VLSSWLGLSLARPQLRRMVFHDYPKTIRRKCFMNVCLSRLANDLVGGRFSSASSSYGKVILVHIGFGRHAEFGFYQVARLCRFSLAKSSYHFIQIFRHSFIPLHLCVFTSSGICFVKLSVFCDLFWSLLKFWFWVKFQQDGFGARSRSKGLRSVCAPNNACRRTWWWAGQN